MNEPTLIEWINYRHEINFQFTGRLAGGRQDGAHRLIDAGELARMG